MANALEKYLGLTPDQDVEKSVVTQSYYFVSILLLVYLVVVKKIGPALMKKRQPYVLKEVLIVYNALQIVINAYIVYLCVSIILYQTEWNGRCYRINTSKIEYKKNFFAASNLYCLLKILDLLDTVFFILRKRYNQVTLLHVYHHMFTCSIAFVIFRYAPLGPVSLIGFINSGVHVIMYLYYLLSVINSKVKESIWWKKYITLIQIVQLLFYFGWTLYPISNGEDCGYPFKFLPFILVQDLIMLILFSNFYIRTYVFKSKNK